MHTHIYTCAHKHACIHSWMPYTHPWECSPACMPNDALHLQPDHFYFISRDQEKSSNRRFFLASLHITLETRHTGKTRICISKCSLVHINGTVFLAMLVNIYNIWHVHLENNLNLFETMSYFSSLRCHFENILDLNDVIDSSDIKNLSHNRYIWRNK